jgi:hypothetical protein
MLGACVTVLCLVGVSACSSGGGKGSSAPTTTGATSTTTPPTTTTTSIKTGPAPVDAQQLIAGHWERLPTAPIGNGDSAVWTGRELIVWGGSTDASGDAIRADGAAYDPRLRRWRRLPPAPLSPRSGEAAVWTGTEMVIWGGNTSSSGNGSPAADGAAYNPNTNRWRLLERAPLPPQSGAVTLANRGDAVILSGRSAAGAVLDGKTHRWRALPPLPVHDTRTRAWIRAVSIGGGRFLGWAHWDYRKATAPNSYQLGGGTDLFRYDAKADRWTAVTAAVGAIPNVEEAFRAGNRVLVRGDTDTCFECTGPGPIPEISAWYEPATNRWTALPSDVLAPASFGADNLESIWTGAALWSFNQDSSIGGRSFHVEPGDASVYDAATRHWTRLSRAPSHCNTPHPLWTGSEILLYCSSNGRAGSADAYVPAPR